LIKMVILGVSKMNRQVQCYNIKNQWDICKIKKGPR
jgi:hypothetical protein